MDKPLAHSFSSLELFDGDFGCPKKYYHLKVAKDYKEEENEYSVSGTRDHKALEDAVKEGTPLPPHLAKHEDKVEVIRNSGMIIKPEEELAITRDLGVTEWWAQDVFLRVKADVALYSGTTAAVLDWKTGTRKPKSFQLELGALTQMIHYPEIKSTEAAFLWLKDDAADKYKYTREKDFDRIKDKLMAKVQKVEDTAADGVWQAKPSKWKCKSCPVRHDCSYSMARY